VRYTTSPAVADVSAGIDLQTRLGGPHSGWRLERTAQQLITFAAVAGVSPTQTTQVQSAGWRVISDDEAWTFTLAADSASLETTRYEGWDTFSFRSGMLLGSLADVVKPELQLRVGLRYINRVNEPRVDTAQEWAEWIDPNIAGIARHQFAPMATAAQQQLNLTLGDGIKATIGHGFYREPLSERLTYLLDFDVYREGTSPFDRVSINSALYNLHRVALQLFQGMITDRLYQYLRGSEE
jgi:uncharacterized protein (TIGR04255 family)